MYYEYFGLSQPPFRITPDTSLFYPGGNRGAILEALIYAIINGEGIVKVVGEVGSGKTMLCRMLEKELPESVEVVYLANPSLSPTQIPFAIALELKLPVQSNSSRLYVMSKLQEYLMREHARNRQVVVFVEEAQAMPLETLEEIRLLSNLETQQHKLLQIALFGQPELDEQLVHREIRQLKERITYSFHLDPFATDDIREYLNTRLRSCGFRAGEIFDRGAIRRIGAKSRGLVRRINILADKSLLAAYADGSRKVTSQHVRKAARDSEFGAMGRTFWQPLLLGVLVLAMCTAGYVWWRTHSLFTREVAAAPASRSITHQRARAIAQVRPAASAAAVAGPKAESKVAEPVGSKDTNARPETAAPLVKTPTAVPNSETPSGQAGNASAAAETPRVDTAPASAGPRQAKSLLGLTPMYQIQDVGDSRLTPEEAEDLRRQLEAHPPEVAVLADKTPAADICRVCWSIVYRPLSKPENL